LNFVGHVAMARLVTADAPFVAGAMLPDFLHMAGAKLVAVDRPEVAAGVENHHQVDAAFHGAPTFVALCASGLASLTAAGVRRGTARAVAHVGTELLLDGLLLRRREVEATYLAGLRWAFPDGLAASVRLAPGGEPRLASLAGRLASRGAPHEYREPAVVADRLEAALGPRPRLAMSGDERAAVEPWLAERRDELDHCAGALLEEVRRRLERAPHATAPA
jgi:hypothetical protein